MILSFVFDKNMTKTRQWKQKTKRQDEKLFNETGLESQESRAGFSPPEPKLKEERKRRHSEIEQSSVNDIEQSSVNDLRIMKSQESRSGFSPPGRKVKGNQRRRDPEIERRVRRYCQWSTNN